MNIRIARTRSLSGLILAASLLLGHSAMAFSGDIIFQDGFEARTQAGCYLDRIFLDQFDGPSHAPLIAAIGDRGTVLGDDPISIDLAPFVSDVDPVERFIWSLSSAPPGMSINAASGLLSWAPVAGQQGKHNVTVDVCDYSANVASTSFQFSVIAPTSPPLISAIDDKSILVDAPYQQTVTASPGGAPPIAYALDDAPFGMQIDPGTGLITWMPGSADLGAHAVIVHATNSVGQADTEPFTLTVINANAAPVLSPIADQGSKPGELFTLTAQASDADGDALQFFLPEHPPGMSIDPTTGVIRWTPASQHAGPNAVTVRVSDPLGFSDTKSFTLTIDQNRAPLAVDDGPYTVERGDTLHVPIPGLLANDSDPNADPLSTVLGSGPSKGVLDFLSDGSFNYTPDNPAGTIGIQLKWSYHGQGSTPNQPPLIIDLDGDGIPEIIQTDTLYGGLNLYAIHGDTGAEYFKIPYANRSVQSGTAMAAADIDLDGHPELVVIGQEPGYSVGQRGKKLMAFEHTGQLKWVSEPLPNLYQTSAGLAHEGLMDGASITIADIDQDGTPEILVGIMDNSLGRIGYQVWDNQGNKLDYVYTTGSGYQLSTTRIEVVDLDLDGVPEIIMGSAAWTHDGQLLWSHSDFTLDFQTHNLYPLVANLDDDPYPEMVREGVYPLPQGTLVAWNHDGSTLWQQTYGPTGYYGHFGALSIADVDNDGKADILVPPSYDTSTFRVLNGADGTLKWSQTAPGSGADSASLGWTATVMDMDNDGYNEVIFLDYNHIFHVWDGRDGSIKGEYPTGEGGHTYGSSTPIFADVDGDGHAELVTTGYSDLLRVYESPQDDWPPMRAIWNQNSYHVTNINDDGTVPQFERPFWLLPGLNQNLVNQRLPEERFNTHDSFTYRASDGELQSNLATVDITILPPNSPPQIFSTARLLASPGFEYIYAVLAVDADVGEVLTYALDQAPAGMTIDANHVIHWTPSAGDVGDHAVVISVTDSVGVTSYQSYTLSVVGTVSVPNVAGQSQAVAVASLTAAKLGANPIEPVFSASVAVGNVVSQVPTGGSNVAAGSDVRLNVSRGVQPIEVPNVLSDRSDDAQDSLTAAGLLVGNVSYVNDAATPRDTVLSQDPAPHALQAPGDPVDLVISGGPRAQITVSPKVIMAGSTAEVAVSVHNADGSLLDPQPAISLTVQIPPDNFFGTLPSLSGNTIQTAADSQGGFQVQAAFDTGMPETIAAPVVAMQSISDGPSGDLFGQFAAQMAQFRDIVDQLKSAVDANDSSAIASLDAQLGDLRDAIDTLRLGSMRPLAPEGGMPPTPADAEANGFPAGPDDFAYKDASLDLIPLLQELENAVNDDGTPGNTLRFLNQSLSENVAALNQLDVQTYGVLDSTDALTSIVGTRIPQLIVADIDRLRQSIADSGVLGGTPAAQAATNHVTFDFSLVSVLSSMSIQTDLMFRLYGSVLYQVARSAGTVAAAHLLRGFTNETTVTGLITASSRGIHVFKVPDSAIEGYGFNTILPEANNVRFIGPDLIDSVIHIFQLDFPSAKDFRDLNAINDKVSGIIEAGQAVNDAYNKGRSLPNGVLRGCLYENSPNCRQLIYSNGIRSVYTSTGGLNLPAPVIIMIYTKYGMGVYVANFLPTRD